MLIDRYQLCIFQVSGKFQVLIIQTLKITDISLLIHQTLLTTNEIGILISITTRLFNDLTYRIF